MSTTDPELLVQHNTDTRKETPPAKQIEESELRRPWLYALKMVLPVFLVTRLLTVMLTYFGVLLFTLKNYDTRPLPLSTFVYSWLRWDARRFDTIALHGYLHLDSAAFFPLLPWLEAVGTKIFHVRPFIIGMVISNIAFLLMLIVLYRLVETEFDAPLAKRSVLYLSVFPTAFFFFAGYNESLFILFMLISLYAMRRGSWWLVGLAGGLAILTRSSGWVLGVGFLYEFIRQVFPAIRQQWREHRPLKCLTLALPLLWILLIPLGLLVFMVYLYPIFHDPFAFSAAQKYWRLGLSFPLYGPFLAIYNIATYNFFSFYTAHNIIDLSALVGSSVLLVLCFVGPYKFRRDQWIFPIICLLSLAIPLLYPGIGGRAPLPSMERFVLEFFPCFIILAMMGRREWVHNIYLMFALSFSVFLTLQFLLGHWTI